MENLYCAAQLPLPLLLSLFPSGRDLWLTLDEHTNKINTLKFKNCFESGCNNQAVMFLRSWCRVLKQFWGTVMWQWVILLFSIFISHSPIRLAFAEEKQHQNYIVLFFFILWVHYTKKLYDAGWKAIYNEQYNYFLYKCFLINILNLTNKTCGNWTTTLSVLL